MESISVVTVTDEELGRHLKSATAQLLACPGRAGRRSEASPAVMVAGRRFAYRPVQSLAGPSSAGGSFSLLELIEGINAKDELPSDAEHHVLRTLRRGIQVGLEIRRSYAEASGLTRLEAAGSPVGTSQAAELEDKLQTAAAVGLFAFAQFVAARLEGYQPDAAGEQSFAVEPPRELSLKNPSEALCLGLAYLHESIEQHAEDDTSLVKAVLESTRLIAAHLQKLEGSLRFVEAYSRWHYRIEPEGITLSGFATETRERVSAVEVQARRPEQIVGNHLAKFEAMRLAQRLVCYDLERQTNPFVELGGFSFTFIGDGMPGTGKTSLIQMMVTQLREYCEQLALPFRYANFSIDQISDYQGRSGQNAKSFCRASMDPKVIALGTIDDVDQVCGNRNDKHASAGQLEVTAVFMQEFAGPNTVVRGNCSFGLFSNYPEKVDDALRQRTQARFLIDGPRRLEDFTDLFYLLLGPCAPMPLGKGYEPFSAQKLRKVIEAKYAEHNVPRLPAIRKIFDRVAKGGKLSTWLELGELLHALHEHDGRFTGRAIANIADAVKFRMMDFDLPEEWFEEPERFFRRPYATKLAMLEELKGTVTPEVLLQEINRYADSEARYADEARARQLDERRQQIVLDTRARLAAAEELSP